MYANYWGKTRPAYHLLSYHCLDVAAVGLEYLQRHSRLRSFLARSFGLPEPVFVAWFTFFLALHDLGKFATSFQAQRPDLLRTLQGQTIADKTSHTRHDSLGYWFWLSHVQPVLASEDWLGLGTAAGDISDYGLSCWVRAVTGHHGRPPLEPGLLTDAFSERDIKAALAFVTDIRALLLNGVDAPGEVDVDRFIAAAERLAWWLAGIAVLADWIGSNTRWFDFCDNPRFALREDEANELAWTRYWQRARRQARVALAEASVLPVESASLKGLTDLFPDIPADGATPLQRLAGELPLGGGPQLFVLEDVTGAGKTEAALLLAHRLLARGDTDGLYFGLPTMATANAMYDRLADAYRRLFAPGTRPSLVLAHGARELDAGFRNSVLPLGVPEDDYGEASSREPEAAGARCAAWIADTRKKALLAQVGVGTLDQALLAVLYSKHQSLRLLGLFGKVLIVDEVHANDAYMHTLLKQLLMFHAAGGGSAILLSATLPRQMRIELVDAYRRGLPRPQAAGLCKCDGYPLLTAADVGDIREIVVATRTAVARYVGVRRFEQAAEVVEALLSCAAAGGCAAWVCNTVADARRAYAQLAAEFVKRGWPLERLMLFHARFAAGDRQRIEDAVLRCFGRRSGPAQRCGRILVATQVIEQSLDLDFDVLASELAPIELLIQRAGRLQRHRRHADGRVRGDDAADERAAPVLLLHSPAPTEEVSSDWFKAPFPKAAKVYVNHARLWIGARLLETAGGFRMPDDARALIEAVYGGLEGAPPALDRHDIRDAGERSAQTSQAQFNALRLDDGYRHDSLAWGEDMHTPTRLGDAELPLRLAVLENGDWRPWCHERRFGWELSTVKVRARFVRERAELDDAALENAAVFAEAAMPDRGRWSVLLPLQAVGDGLYRGAVIDDEGARRWLYYDARNGLIREDELQEPEDG